MCKSSAVKLLWKSKVLDLEMKEGEKSSFMNLRLDSWQYISKIQGKLWIKSETN